jgi:hypothetical protein
VLRSEGTGSSLLLRRGVVVVVMVEVEEDVSPEAAALSTMSGACPNPPGSAVSSLPACTASCTASVAAARAACASAAGERGVCAVEAEEEGRGVCGVEGRVRMASGSPSTHRARSRRILATMNASSAGSQHPSAPPSLCTHHRRDVWVLVSVLPAYLPAVSRGGVVPLEMARPAAASNSHSLATTPWFTIQVHTCASLQERASVRRPPVLGCASAVGVPGVWRMSGGAVDGVGDSQHARVEEMPNLEDPSV